MTLQTTGAITLLDIRTEFGGTSAYALGAYYRGGGLVPAGTAAGTGSFQGHPLASVSPVQIPTSGPIQFSMFYGTSNFVQTVFIFNSSQTWVVPAGVTSVEMILVGGGGGGGGTRDNVGDGAGGAGAGGVQYRRALGLTPGSSMFVGIGGGGAGAVNGSGGQGGDSTFAGLTALGGGGGGGGQGASQQGVNGGSGGGGCGLGVATGPGFPVASGGAQLGFEGGSAGVLQNGGGGGGYWTRGIPSTSLGNGGQGLVRTSLSPNFLVSLAGGGGGGASGGSATPGVATSFGGNGGVSEGSPGSLSGANGGANSGGGGGGAGARINAFAAGGNGGSGVLILVWQQTFPTGAMQSASGLVSVQASRGGGNGSANASITFGSNRLNSGVGTVTSGGSGSSNVSSVWPQWRTASSPEDSNRRYFITATVTSGIIRNSQNNTNLTAGQSVSYSFAGNVSFQVSASTPPAFSLQSGTFNVVISEYIGGPALASGTVNLSADSEF